MHIISYDIAGWSSLEARRAHNPKVIGSNPVPATREIFLVNAQIAQLVEQRTENPRVTGSIPVLGIFLLYRKLCLLYNKNASLSIVLKVAYKLQKGYKNSTN